MARNDAAANVGRKPNKEKALNTLEALIQVPLRDIEELCGYVERGDFKGGQRAARRIRKRINKYGF